ncbi:hypothetical protein Pcinc_031583 [Petrolisthes cinctipes]|uniref:Uncharacterized protein n=1 Tax=Petrolisthes cinctipes TaxID=88211 RepID=A0AAE1K2U4_PETCI|nr:hypothetical protein Pcinc_031583 [Petrolisthes cinctipes]
MHLQGNFQIFKKRCKVTLTDECLTWLPEEKPECCRRVPINQIVGSWLCPRGSTSSCCSHDITTQPTPPTPTHPCVPSPSPCHNVNTHWASDGEPDLP